MWHGLIISLILWPAEPAVPTHAPPEAWQALKDIALAAEIVGPHENWATDFNSELRYVRRHYRGLQGAPPLADAYWLPSAAYAKELCDFNEQFQEHLRGRAVIYPWRATQLDQVLIETRHLHCLWDAVRRASSPGEAWALRRRKLAEIREQLSPEAWRHRELPPAVPVRWFVPIRD